MSRVVHIRNKKRSDKHGILQARSIVFVAMILNPQKRPPRKYCYQQSRLVGSELLRATYNGDVNR